MSDWTFECTIHEHASYTRECPICKKANDDMHEQIDAQRARIAIEDKYVDLAISNRILREKIALAEKVVAFYANPESWRTFKGHMRRPDSRATCIDKIDFEQIEASWVGGKLAREYME